MKRISILGSTGSIGVQSLDVVRLHRDRFSVCALAAGSNIDLLEKQAREFEPSVISCADTQTAERVKKRLGDISFSCRIVSGEEGAEEAAAWPEADLVIGGLPAGTGLKPTFAAVRAGKNIALATKEVLVTAGRLFMDEARAAGVKILPVDSEQSAIFQCLEGHADARVRRIILTASGGPFREMSAEEMTRVTRAQTLDHPRWKMGPKVTVDSATLMNKGLEVIEARWLFDTPGSRIETVIHPQSICHSMVEFEDGSILAQLGATDMRIPISYAMAYPERIDSGTVPLDFPELGRLTFEGPDTDRFPLLKAAYDALEYGDEQCIVLNAADEAAVELFLNDEIDFPTIPRIVLSALDAILPPKVRSLDDVIDLHDSVKARTLEATRRRTG